MEHLSAEERACLMYLEETIEALEVQEDSGLSNDELDLLLQAEKMTVNDISTFKSDESGRDQKSDKAEHHAFNQTSEPQSFPASAANMKDLETNGDEDGQLKIVTNASLFPDQSTKASEMDLGLIPPPSNFRDEARPPPQPLTAKDLLPSTGISRNKPGAPVDLEELRQRASLKRTLVNSPVTQDPPNQPPELRPIVVNSGLQPSPPPEAAEPRSPPAVAPKPKKLPANIILKSHKAAAADGNSGHPMPTSSDRLLTDHQRVRLEALRKLGLLKSDESDSSPTLSPNLSPKSTRSWAAPSSPLSPAAPHTPTTTPSYTHLNSPFPASVPLQSPGAVSPSAPSTPPVVLPFDIVPAPAAFSDPDSSLPSDYDLSAAKDLSEATVNAKVNTPPRTPPALVKQLTPPKAKGVKSASLERSGLGLSSYLASQDSNEAGQHWSGKQSPSQLRNSRPRPASLGCGKEFSSAQGEGLQVGHATSKEPDLRRSLPAFQHSRDSQKLPRSQGISVLICPRAENGDNRREALKRLGLLRD